MYVVYWSVQQRRAVTGLSSTPSICFAPKCSEARISLPAAEPMISSRFGRRAEDAERERARVGVVAGQRCRRRRRTCAIAGAERAVVQEQRFGRSLGRTGRTSTRNTGPQSENGAFVGADLGVLGADVGQRDDARPTTRTSTIADRGADARAARRRPRQRQQADDGEDERRRA